MNSIVYFNQELSFAQLESVLLELFPDYVLFPDDPKTTYPQTINWNRLDHAWVHILLSDVPREFMHGINLESGSANSVADYRKALHIARKISDNFNIKTLAEYPHPDYVGELGICILFNQGKTYLADDYFDGPMNGGEPGKGVVILQEFEIPHYRFDSTGDCIEIINNDEI